MSQQTSVQSNLTPAANSSDVERIQFVVNAALAGLRTAMPVKVMSVSNNGGVSPVGTVSVQPLVSGADGMGNSWPHGTIYNVPYMRIQGGANAVIIDPQVGDIGVASVCDRDISTVKSASAVSAPGSNRKHDMSDIVYLMTIIGAAPTQYVQFSSSGINVTSPTKIVLAAPAVEIDAPTIILNGALQQGQGSNAGNATMGGTLTVTTDVVGGGKSLKGHTHTAQGATAVTTPPN